MAHERFPLILFLDDDLDKSAQALTPVFLELNIRNTSHVLMNYVYYFVGIRSKRIHKYRFSKDHKRETMSHLFTGYPFKDPPAFSFYNSIESKWCRLCKEHYDYVLKYFNALLDEYFFRYHVEHRLAKLSGWYAMAIYESSLRLGYVVNYAHIKKLNLPYRNLPARFRKLPIVEGYRNWYRNEIADPLKAYDRVPRDIPDWLLKDKVLQGELIVV